MSLDRSPSRSHSGGWSSPGLTEDSGCKSYGQLDVTWAGVKDGKRKAYPRYQTRNEGFFSRHYRRISEGLLQFVHGMSDGNSKDRRRPTAGRLKGLPRRIALLLSRRRRYTALALVLLLVVFLWFQQPLAHWLHRASLLGGGSKFVIILGANQGGGVMEWKGAREWAIERDSVRNKKAYAAAWGYELEIVDMSTKKRYAHEWRESWEKVDVIRNSMKKYPKAEWFWWLDLNTFIMEPRYSLQKHIFNNLARNTYRDINLYNPLKIQHPPNGTSGDPNAPLYANYLDDDTLSPVGDNNPASINLIVPQDCSGFNLGSFFVRRSAWTDRILDIWWDPVFYEQKHMEWEHKEQDALEYIYSNQPWIRPHVAFIAQRLVNAFPPGACGDDKGLPPNGCDHLKEGDEMRECGIQGIHYQQSERDFLVNMAGCEWGRDCWGEMYNFRTLSNKLNRNRWER
ncbi:glycosyltransferase family 34 protein, partial [Piedraia hortae CBS 480.64]